MKIILAPDSFKGSLTATEITLILKQAVESVFPGCMAIALPMADGGEGTMEIAVTALGGHFAETTVKDPLFRDHKARIGFIPDGCCILEIAEASGLPLVPDAFRDPLKTSTWGTGQLILSALEAGCQNISVGIGGSATNDGGIGAMAALGAKFFDQNGNALSPIAVNLERISRIDASGMPPRISEIQFVVMCDVQNPLTGANGATNVYGPQKGATAEKLEQLERGMQNYACVLSETFGFDPNTPGAGAAGGLGAALQAFLGAKLQSGVEVILQLYNFDARLANADLVITGEGRVDGQSAQGKVLCGVGGACKKKNIPVIAITGGLGAGYEQVYECGISSIMLAVSGVMTLQETMNNAPELLFSAAKRMLRMIKTGIQIRP